jgi:ubiquinone/menaquinone biosynthesis C-methylase UbiE
VISVDDISRLRVEYEDRKHRLSGSDLYSFFNPSHLYTIHQRQRAILSVLKHRGMIETSRLKILEMGCGTGGVLAEFLGFGVPSSNLFGVDLLGDDLTLARQALPGCSFTNADGQFLPFPANSFDVVMQYTAISSILDTTVRHRICADMLRVVKGDGLILSYDFWLNPMNSQTRALRPSEIRILFPGCRFEFHRITLAPPLTRKLAPLSWVLCLFLESLKILNTHYLAIIQP